MVKAVTLFITRSNLLPCVVVSGKSRNGLQYRQGRGVFAIEYCNLEHQIHQRVRIPGVVSV